MNSDPASRGATASVKSILLIAHRWIGLVLSPIFLLILVSGAVLAFQPILSDFGTEAATTVDPAALVRMIDSADPQGRGSVTISGGDLVLRSAAEGAASAFDLKTGKPVAAPVQGFDVFGFAERLHRSLLVGAGALVELATYAMVAIIVIGPLLAWPRLRNTVLGWHIATGWWLYPVVLLTPLTGLLMALHIGAPSMPRPAAGGPAIKPARAIERLAREQDVSGLVSARNFRGGSVLVTIRTPSADVGYMVTGDAITRIDPNANVVRAIHLGTWAGAWSGLLNLVSAIVLIGLTGTGAWSWFARWRLSGRAPDDASADILVAFASQTGTAARLAGATAARLAAGGERAVCGSLGVVDPATLPGYRLVLIIASTTGDGAVPDQAAPFLRKLGRQRVDGASVAVLGLGDRRYPYFCAGAETLRDALVTAGASEAFPMARVDRAPEAAWQDWLGEITSRFGLTAGRVELPEIDRPVTLTLAVRERLNQSDAADVRAAWHIVLTSDEPLDYRAGDLLLIAPGPKEAARSYSIASTSQADPRKVELSVGLSSWNDESGEEHLGAVSGRLCRSLPVGARIEAALRRHPDFNLPDDPARPVVMVGTGCGVAPFIGFLGEIEVGGLHTPAWLVFGNRRSDADFFHRDRLRGWLERKVLTRLDTAFSRDENDGHYVQDRLVENGAELKRWLIDRDAVLYVCGRASTLRRTIDDALAEVLVAHAGLSRQDAETRLENWAGEGKLRRDLFD